MKHLQSTAVLIALVALFLINIGCNPPVNEEAEKIAAAHAITEANIEMYSELWDDIINKAELDLFNPTHFTEDVVFHMAPENVVGIKQARDYYANFTTGFSNIEFTIEDVFGSGDKIVKHWVFKGKHTGEFFGIPASQNDVSLAGVTLVRMANGKIAEEQDFFDNLEFYQQLGLIPRD